MGRFAGLLVGVATAACSSAEPSVHAGASGAEIGGAAGSGAGAGIAGTAASSGVAGSGQPVDAPDSRTMSDVTFTPEAGGTIRTFELGVGYEVIADSTDWLRVVSSAYYKHAADDARWIARVENIGPGTLCHVQIEPVFFDARGEQLSFRPYIGMLLGQNFVLVDYGYSACLRPGDFGMVTARDASPWLDIPRVAEIHYRAYGLNYDDVVPGERIEIGDLEQDGSVVRGTLTNTDTIQFNWWAVHVFAHDADGYPAGGQEFLEDVSPVPVGHVWSFETAPFTVPVIGYDVFVTMSYNGPLY